MLSEIRHAQKHKYCTIYLSEASRAVKSIETESTMVVAKGLGVGENMELFSGCRVSVFQVEKSSESGTHSNVNAL